MQELSVQTRQRVMAVPSDHASLPASYEAAVQALANCEQLDECKAWIDKSSALASYTRQAKDQALFRYAQRINTRAWLRAGMLLEQVERGDTYTRFGQEGGLPPVTRAQAAADAGMSEWQAKQALRIARVPTQEFERQVESDNPPTATALAKQGIIRTVVHNVIGDVDPEHHKQAVQVIGTIYDFTRMMDRYPDPSIVWRGLEPRARTHLPDMIRKIDAWMDKLAVSQPED